MEITLLSINRPNKRSKNYKYFELKSHKGSIKIELYPTTNKGKLEVLIEDADLLKGMGWTRYDNSSFGTVDFKDFLLKNIGESYNDKYRKDFFYRLYYDTQELKAEEYRKDETKTKVASIQVEIPRRVIPLVLDDKSSVRHPEVVLDEDGEIEVHLPIGLTDEYTVSKRRKEQSMLRATLMKDAPNHLCAICGNLLPNELLIAAHIKKRKYATEEERKKFSIVVPMCKLGCDSLFEDGWIGVVDKRVTRICTEKSTQYLEETIERIVGRECTNINELSSIFYDWHFLHHLNKIVSKN